MPERPKGGDPQRFIGAVTDYPHSRVAVYTGYFDGAEIRMREEWLVDGEWEGEEAVSLHFGRVPELCTLLMEAIREEPTDALE